jgi:hypothetical protein
MLPPCIENSTRERGTTFVKLPEIQPPKRFISEGGSIGKVGFF